MELLKTPRLRTLQLQTFTENVIKVCQDPEELKVRIQRIVSKLDAFKIGIGKVRKYTDRQPFDQPRDLYCTNFFTAFSIEETYPDHDEASQNSLNQLKEIVHRHDKYMVRLPMDEETSAMSNFLEEVEAIDLTPLEGTGLVRWLNLMAVANKEFKSFTEQSLSHQLSSNSIDSATTASVGLIEELDELFKYIFAKLMTEPTEELNTCYSKIAILIENFEN